MNYPSIRSNIRVFSFCPAYFVSETKEEIKRMWMINSFGIPPYIATVDCSKRTRKYIETNSHAIRSHIRVFSFRPAYFFSETKEVINTYADDIYFRYPAIRSHIRVFSFRLAYFESEMKEDINTYVDDIYFQYPVIFSHIIVFSFHPTYLI